MTKANVGDGGKRKSLLKHLLWTTAGSLYLGGLCNLELEHDWLGIRKLDMPLANLPPAFDGVTIAQISDLHCSPIVREAYLRRCIEKVNKLDPDYVAITGDFITGPRSYARKVGQILKELSPRIATLACLGNHDFGVVHPSGAGFTKSLAEHLTDELYKANVKVLRNSWTSFGVGRQRLQFVGLDDYWCNFHPGLAYKNIDMTCPTVTLCHNPDATQALMKQGWQLVLSGHTHGSPTPARLNRWMPMEYRNLVVGHYEIVPGKNLYINAGLGHAWRWRQHEKPEITLLKLHRWDQAPAQA